MKRLRIDAVIDREFHEMKTIYLFILAVLNLASVHSIYANGVPQIETESFEYLHASDECPSLNALNYSTQYWHEWTLQFLTEDVIVREFLDSISLDLDLGSLVPLTDRRDASLCKRLNRLGRGLHTDVVYDRAYNRTVPITYSIYYRQSGHIVEIVGSYSQGTSAVAKVDRGERAVGPPTMGRTVLKVYDQGLNLLGKLSL